MSNTSYQRGVDDLKAAGLNPALAYGKAGASSPSGSAASGGAASGQAASGTAARFDSSAGAGLSSATSVGGFLQDVATKAASREEIAARTAVHKAEADRVRTLLDAELENLRARSKDANSAAHYRFLQGNNLLQMFPVEYALKSAQGRESEARTASAEQSFRESAARTLLLGSQKRLTDTQGQLAEYEIPTAKNIAGAADTWFMKNIAPYLGSAKGVVDLFNPFSRILGRPEIHRSTTFNIPGKGK